MCRVTNDVFRTSLLLLQNSHENFSSFHIVKIHLPFILKYLLLSSGQQLKNQPTTAVAASASAAAEPGSSPWLSPAKWDIVLLWHICAQYYPQISICIAYELLWRSMSVSLDRAPLPNWPFTALRRPHSRCMHAFVLSAARGSPCSGCTFGRTADLAYCSHNKCSTPPSPGTILLYYSAHSIYPISLI